MCESNFFSSKMLAIFALALSALFGGCDAPPQSPSMSEESGVAEREEPFTTRPLELTGSRGQWLGDGISYAPFREGQSPDGAQPTKEEIAEDIALLVDQGFTLFRVYSSDPFARDICDAVRENPAEVKLIVGAWIAPETDEQAKEKNRQQVANAVSMGNDYGDIVAAITIGNETQVSWSFHKVDPNVLIGHVREARWQTIIPVGVADDFTFWTSDQSDAIVSEIDFIMTHIYAHWHAQPLADALAFTKEKLGEVKTRHSRKTVVIGEAGWATGKQESGEQAERLVGAAGEQEQAQFMGEFREWIKDARVPAFYFEAFDQAWKGSEDPNDAEKHWGIFNVDRTPKTAAAKEEATTE